MFQKKKKAPDKITLEMQNKRTKVWYSVGKIFLPILKGLKNTIFDLINLIGKRKFLWFITTMKNIMTVDQKLHQLSYVFYDN